MDVEKVHRGNGPAIARNIQTKAKAHGTFVSPTNGEILYIDPDHEDERHHSPMLTPAEAKDALTRGLIVDEGKEKDAKDLEVERDPNAIGTIAAARTEEFAKADDEGGPGSGTLDSRSSTAWSDRDRVEGGVQGHASGLGAPVGEGIDEVSGDEDAARRRRAAVAGAANAARRL